MKEFEYVIKDNEGIHARPAGMLAKEVKKYKSTIRISKDNKSADASKLMAVMALGVKGGQTIKVEIEGEDEENAFTAVKDFLNENL